MFGKKNTKKTAPVNNSISTLAKGTFIEGDLVCEGTLVIEGNFFGAVSGCHKLVIGEYGTVNGTVDVNNAMIFGGVDGEVSVNELLHIQSSGKIKGNITTNKICIDIGGEFTGNCRMGADAPAKRATDTKKLGKQNVAETGKLFVETKAS